MNFLFLLFKEDSRDYLGMEKYPVLPKEEP